MALVVFCGLFGLPTENAPTLLPCWLPRNALTPSGTPNFSPTAYIVGCHCLDEDFYHERTALESHREMRMHQNWCVKHTFAPLSLSHVVDVLLNFDFTKANSFQKPGRGRLLTRNCHAPWLGQAARESRRGGSDGRSNSGTVGSSLP